MSVSSTTEGSGLVGLSGPRDEAQARGLEGQAPATVTKMVRRPRTRGECVDGPRPCPWKSCRHHLGDDFRGKQSLESCALDVADRGDHTLREVGRIMGVTRERIRQIEAEALRALYGQVG